MKKNPPSQLLDLLRTVRERQGRISLEELSAISVKLGIPESQVHSAASFYPELSEKREKRDRLERGIEKSLGVFSPADPIRWQSSPEFPRRALARCGVLDPVDLPAFLSAGAYEGLRVARAMAPERVIRQVEDSGLRGMGGAGFLTARKWQTAAATAADQKVVVCNAAEGDLGAWMDRAILEADPHAVFEGMAIAAHAIGASRGFVYLRAEYAALRPRMERVLEVVRESGILGEFELEIFLAAGAYICGEETALLNSMEGKAGRPRMRPPFPAQAGLWGMPTVVNNVKTLAQVPLILRHGSAWFSALGTERSKGTAILCLGGDIQEPGVIEVPMGTPLADVINLGKGVRNGKRIKAVQTGGPLGGFIPGDKLDLPISFESFADAGSPLGAGGLIVISEERNMVELARDFCLFAREESCGNCAPCRLGTVKMAEILQRLCLRKGEKQDLDELEFLGEMMTKASFCAFGQGAPAVALSAMKNFRGEFEACVDSTPVGDGTGVQSCKK